MNKRDVEILQELGRKVAEIAHLPRQEKTKQLWTMNNDLTPARPMVYIDQLPWHELVKSGELTLECEDPFLREIERQLRETLYRWKHFPCDMVVENYIEIQHDIHNLDYGIHIEEDILKTDETNDIVSHRYKDQVKDYDDLEKLKNDEIWVDRELDELHMAMATEIFKDIMPVRFGGVQIHSGIWDRIAQMRPAESLIWDLIDRPEFTEAVVKKFVDLTMSTVDQCEELGLLDPQMQYIHCTGAYTNQLPKAEGGKKLLPRMYGLWEWLRFSVQFLRLCMKSLKLTL